MHTPNNVINIFNVCFMCIQVYDEYITSNIIRIYNKRINVCARVYIWYYDIHTYRVTISSFPSSHRIKEIFYNWTYSKYIYYITSKILEMGHPTFGIVRSELMCSKERIIFHILLMQYERDQYRGLALNCRICYAQSFLYDYNKFNIILNPIWTR